MQDFPYAFDLGASYGTFLGKPLVDLELDGIIWENPAWVGRQ